MQKKYDSFFFCNFMAISMQKIDHFVKNPRIQSFCASFPRKIFTLLRVRIRNDVWTWRFCKYGHDIRAAPRISDLQKFLMQIILSGNL